MLGGFGLSLNITKWNEVDLGDSYMTQGQALSLRKRYVRDAGLSQCGCIC